MSFLEALDPAWLEGQYRRWLDDPEQLDETWRAFFAGFDLADARQGRPGPIPGRQSCVDCSLKLSGVHSLISRYRSIGHLLACTDPLSPCSISHPLLDLAAFDLEDADLETLFTTRHFHRTSATLREIVADLRETYCRAIGVEFMHIADPAERQWLIERMEPARNRTVFSEEARRGLLRILQEAVLFEEFLQRKFVGQKRFSLEGGEVLVVLLDRVAGHAAASGVTDLVFGMSHRGRLNVLANILGKPLANIFAEFQDNLEHAFVGEGDVKYHKGFSSDREYGDGRRIHLTLAFNPSHLEVVSPVVEGKSRARQDRMGGEGPRRILPLLVHGDAAFAGQGVVAETLNLSQLEGYGTGGTLHVVLNNQIGFTTLPEDARSTRYATDVAKMLSCPIFHVHGEEPEAVAHVARLAVEYRQAFGRDVIVEIICYRRHGHNEGDEPYFTQPQMYDRIRERPPVHRLYADALVEAGALSADAVTAMEAEVARRLEQALAGSPQPAADLGFGGAWQGISRDYEPAAPATGVPGDALRALAERLAVIPDGCSPHPKVAAIYQRRVESVRQGSGLDWGNAEALAFASLLDEGITVRLSGQDSRRGTFNHRHAVLHDLASGTTFTPLAGIASKGAQFQVFDSMLSENAVLGFEYGYAVASPDALVIWEAQFGDFANGAQVIIDQFIAAGASKWDRSCGLVMLLPHGYEGQGAEHSSARIERFLSLCAEENLFVCYPSTPGQLFHLLRRQMKLPFRKPLIVFTPKSLLRHPRCSSALDELAEGGFREVIADDAPADQIRTVLLCSGKIAHELLERREDEGRNDVAIIRLEQYYPFRAGLLLAAAAPLQSVSDWRWVQEEPANMGAWTYLRPLLAAALGREVAYVGRPQSAAPATGSHRQHKDEQDRVLAKAFG